jgi:hypothetical protein
MSRSYNGFVMFGLCLLLLTPSIVSTGRARAFVEGLHVTSGELQHNSLTIVIDAIKRVDGTRRQSEVHIVYRYAFVDGRREFDATVVLDGDPDQLEVSRDLGWSGLDATINVQWRRVDCVEAPVRSCSPEIVESVPVELHLSLFATEPYRQEGGLFKRNANALNPTTGVIGTIRAGNRVTRLEFGAGMTSVGYNFSDQFPG